MRKKYGVLAVVTCVNVSCHGTRMHRSGSAYKGVMGNRREFAWERHSICLSQSSVLHCVVCCSVLQCAAVCCSVLQCVAVCCSVLQCVAVCCSVLRCVAMCCSVLQHMKESWEPEESLRGRDTAQSSVLQCAVCCSVLQCVAVCCGARGEAIT